MQHRALEVERCTIIPDIHQDIAWVERVLASVPHSELIIFLGDYFDTTPRQGDRCADVVKTCEFLVRIQAERGSRAVFLLGNHDIQYLEALAARSAGRSMRSLFYGCGDAYDPRSTVAIAEFLPALFWSGARLFVVVNGHLLSHAGLARRFWPERGTVTESLDALEGAAIEALATSAVAPNPLLDVGWARGGTAENGGLTWQDWNLEFADELPLPQIVGHTRGSGVRKKGKSWCIDGGQTTVGLLTAQEFTHRRIA